jgi:3-oxoacyl-[acyl-carrier protein] reductase
MFSEFKDQVILITGAAGGIGSTLVREFSRYRAKVYQTDIADAVEEEGYFIRGDISDPGFIASLVKQVVDREGRIDILVNNAGICPRTPVKDITLEEWNRVMDINLTSLFLLSQAVLDVMTGQNSGCIINLSSLAGKIGGITVGAHYSASKAAIECLTKTFAKIGAPHGVRVNAVAPGIIDTEMQNGVTPEQMENLMRTIPMGRQGTTGEVAGAIMMLASGVSSYITGINLDVNGGLYM